MSGYFFGRLARTAASLLLAGALAASAAAGGVAAGGAAVDMTRAGTPAAGALAADGADRTLPDDRPFSIVAFGDSLTAGYTYGMENEPNPVPYGYVERVYEQALLRGMRAEMSNYGILGLKTAGLQRLLEAIADGRTIAASELQDDGKLPDPRLAQMLAAAADARDRLERADLVLVTIGANDISPVLDLLAAGSGAADAWLEEAFASYAASLDASLRAIVSVNPHARVVVADQYSPLPVLPLLGIGQEQYDYAQRIAAQMRDRLQRVIGPIAEEGYDVTAAYAAQRFIGKETAYTSIIASRGDDIHPTQAGYQAMGEAFAEAIWGEARSLAPRADGVPISVVVKGEEVASAFKPIVRDGRAYLVLRDIGDAMGATTVWDGAAQTATVTYGGRQAELAIGARTMRVNGVEAPLETPAFLERAGGELKTYVPLAALSAGLGFDVVYRDTLKVAFVNE